MRPFYLRCVRGHCVRVPVALGDNDNDWPRRLRALNAARMRYNRRLWSERRARLARSGVLFQQVEQVEAPARLGRVVVVAGADDAAVTVLGFDENVHMRRRLEAMWRLDRRPRFRGCLALFLEETLQSFETTTTARHPRG